VFLNILKKMLSMCVILVCSAFMCYRKKVVSLAPIRDFATVAKENRGGSRFEPKNFYHRYKRSVT